MSSLSDVVDAVLRCVPPGILPLQRLEQRRQKAFCNNFDWPNSEYNSQYGQDQYIWKTVFKEQCRSGFFLDIGAYDGTTFSNSYFFERVAGFDGLLIEPNPRAFQKLKSVRRTESINCGIGPLEGILEYIQCDGQGEQLSCLAEFASDDHLARIEEERLRWGFDVSRISVPVRPITAVLSESYNVHRPIERGC